MATNRQHLYQKRDRLVQLQAFCYAAKFESMTEAAEHLLLGQQAVSLHVRELEHELGARLFERKGPRITLSSAGEHFYELVRPLMEGVDGLPAAFAEESEYSASRDLQIFSGDAGTLGILPRALKRLHDESPDISVRVKSGVLGNRLPKMLADKVRLVLATERPIPEDIVYHPVLSYDLVLITSPEHPIAGRDSVSREEIAASPVIVPDSGTYGMQGENSPFRHLEIETDVVIEVSGWDVVERYVEANLGIAFYPSFCLTEPRQVSVIPLLGQNFPRRSYGWFMQRDKPLPRQARQLIEATDAEFADGAQEAS